MIIEELNMKKFWELLLNDVIQDKSRLTESYSHQFNYDGRIKTAFEYPYSRLKIIERYSLNDEYKSAISKIFDSWKQCEAPYRDDKIGILKEQCPDEILELFKNIILNAIHDDKFYVPKDGCNFVLRQDWIAEPCIFMELTLKLKEGKKVTLKEVQSHFNRDSYSDNEFYTKDIDF